MTRINTDNYVRPSTARVTPQRKRNDTMTTDAVVCSLTKDGNTWYVFADSGEMLASGPGRTSTVEDLLHVLRSRGVARYCMDGVFFDVPAEG